MSLLLSPTETLIPSTHYSIEEIMTNRALAIKYQQPIYGNVINATHNVDLLMQSPPLVSGARVRLLKRELAKVVTGDKILIQAGLCAERMIGQTDDDIRTYANGMTEMMYGLNSVVGKSLQKPGVMVMRGAGQFAKPRSQAYEATGEMTFRGEMINCLALDQRDADPKLLIAAYDFSAKVLRMMSGKGIYTSQEGLSLAYQMALHQTDEYGDYAGSGDMIWIGDRTNEPDGPHVQFAAGIDNPIGLKCGPNMTPEKLDALIKTLNPYNEPGKLTLIFRMGADKIDAGLPKLLEVAAQYQDSIVSICDPMHGNTKTDPTTGLKTRYMDDMAYEIEAFVRLCKANGVRPGGLHMEVSPFDVTECLGEGVTDLRQNYQTLVDPCANPVQGKILMGVFCKAYKA